MMNRMTIDDRSIYACREHHSLVFFISKVNVAP